MKRIACALDMRSIAILQSAMPLTNIAVHADAWRCAVFKMSISKPASEIALEPAWFSKIGRPMNAEHGASGPTRRRVRAACHAAGKR